MMKIKLDKNNETIALCSSKWFGNPDMPDGIKYPEFEDFYGDVSPYNFLCQIRLEEVALFDKESLLPPKGMLYFFAKLDYSLGRVISPDQVFGHYISSKDDVVVFYIEDINPQECSEYIVSMEGEDYAPKGCSIEFCNQSDEDLPSHQLLGAPSMMPSKDWKTPCEGWQLLLQVDSDEDIELKFMDKGLLCFIIDPQHLKDRDFSNVRAIVVPSKKE